MIIFYRCGGLSGWCVTKRRPELRRWRRSSNREQEKRWGNFKALSFSYADAAAAGCEIDRRVPGTKRGTEFFGLGCFVPVKELQRDFRIESSNAVRSLDRARRGVRDQK